MANSLGQFSALCFGPCFLLQSMVYTQGVEEGLQVHSYNNPGVVLTSRAARAPSATVVAFFKEYPSDQFHLDIEDAHFSAPVPPAAWPVSTSLLFAPSALPLEAFPEKWRFGLQMKLTFMNVLIRPQPGTFLLSSLPTTKLSPSHPVSAESHRISSE